MYPGGAVGAAGFFALYVTLGGKVDICGRDDLFFALHLTLGGEVDIGERDNLFFCSLLDFGRNTDAVTFKDPVLLLRSENISGPAGMALNCAPSPFKFLGTPLLGDAQVLSKS